MAVFTKGAESLTSLLVFSPPGETFINGQPTLRTVGNTWRVAEQLAARLHVPPQAITPRDAYPTTYPARLARATAEQRAAALPAIQPLPATVLAESVWFVGYPLWFGGLPRVIATLRQQAAVPPRVIYPFVTHEGGGFGHSLADLRTLFPTTVIRPGLPVRGSRAERSGCAVDHWLAQYPASIQ